VQTDRSHRLLLVDDNPAGLLALHDALELKLPGLHVDAVTTAEDGVALLAEHRYDCAICDVLLPPGRMDGLEFMRTAQSHDSELPVILVTAGEFIREEQALREGAFAFLPKPLEIGATVRIVREALNRPAVLRDAQKRH
jgi:DNA-binding NtrC family response regulator